MTQKRSLEHLHAIELPTPFPVGPVTVFLADAPGEPRTLIDTGPRAEDTRAALDAGLERLGYHVIDLERIIVTHAHADHFGLAAELVTESHAEVLSHAWNSTSLGDYDGDRAQQIAFYAGLMQQAAVPVEIMTAIGRATGNVNRYAQPVAVDTTLHEGDTLRMAGRDWRVLHTPGHSAGLICLYEPVDRILLSSDHLLADISSNPLVEPPPPGETERPRSLVLYQQSLQRVASMRIERALPSHGPIIHDVPGLVRERIEFHQQRVARVLEAIQQGAQTTWDVTQALFPDLSPLDTFLAISEVIGHLDLLELEGRIESVDSEGIAVWRLVQGQEPVSRGAL